MRETPTARQPEIPGLIELNVTFPEFVLANSSVLGTCWNKAKLEITE